MILEKEVLVRLNSQTAIYYQSLNYKIPKYKDENGIMRVKRGTEILVKVKELPKYSNVKLTKICNYCGKKVKVSYNKILKGRDSSYGFQDKCKECSDIMKIKLVNNNKISNNYIAKSEPSFAQLLWDKSDAYKYTPYSNKKTDFKCPTCKMKINNKRIEDVYKYGLSCSNCSDGKSYPEKFIFNLLSQLKVEFISEKTFEWSEGKRYDFYLPDYNMIIEVNGGQHYKEGFKITGGRSLKEERENDKLKEDLAKLNYIIEYVTINAKYSNFDYIKSSILNNYEFKKIFDISHIDFLKCHEFATNSVVKLTSDLYNLGYSVSEIAKKLLIHRKTVSNYLKRATELKWCNYIPHFSKYNPVVQLTKDGVYLNEFKNMTSAKEATGATNISNTCSGRSKTSGGYKWMYKEDYIKQHKNSIDNGGNVID